MLHPSTNVCSSDNVLIDFFLYRVTPWNMSFMDGDDCDSIQDDVLLYRSTFDLDTKLSHVARNGVCVELGVHKTGQQHTRACPQARFVLNALQCTQQLAVVWLGIWRAVCCCGSCVCSVVCCLAFRCVKYFWCVPLCRQGTYVQVGCQIYCAYFTLRRSTPNNYIPASRPVVVAGITTIVNS